ncbi:MAG: putative epoxidase, partial [Ilumatobacteraceae bacterium]|nr:putative epoxidase [Ilumatobacteraceae bacterium]
EALDAEPADMVAMARRYDESLREQIWPWYHAAVVHDSEARRVSAALLAGEDPDADADDPRTFARGLFRDGLAPATRRDPVVLRAFMRTFNMLVAPDALRADEDVAARVLAVWAERGSRPPQPDLGPKTRKELLELLPP